MRYQEFDKRFKSLSAMYPEANMKVDFERRITKLDLNFFVSGTFIDGKRFEREKYGNLTAFITDRDYFSGFTAHSGKYQELYSAFYAMNIPFTDYEFEENLPRTVTVDEEKSFCFMTEMVTDPTFQDHKISNLLFSLALRYLQRLHSDYVLIKPYPTDIPKQRFKKYVQQSIYQLIEYYRQYAFEITVGEYSIE